jgi:predicted O-methyltransferase YrrM
MSAVAIPRRVLGRLYRRGAAPLGRRALDRMLRDGLPARLRAPLEFLFTDRASPDVKTVAARIEQRRLDIAGRRESYRFTESRTPLGVVRWPERVAPSSMPSPLSLRWLAGPVSVPRRWGVFLHLCGRAFDARAIAELGSCVGISGAYLASIPSHPRFVTVEGSPALAAIARETLAAVSSRSSVLEGPFEGGLGRACDALAAERLSVDVAFIDGHHQEAPTVHYVHRLRPHLSSEALIILDDIHLSAPMWRAWQRVRAMPGVIAGVDVGRFGLLVWDADPRVNRQYDLALYTGWWRAWEGRA